MLVQLATGPNVPLRLEGVKEFEETKDGVLKVIADDGFKLYSFNRNQWLWFSVEQAGDPNPHANPRLGEGTTYGLLSGQEEPKP